MTPHEQRVACCYCQAIHIHGPIPEKEAEAGNVRRMSHCTTGIKLQHYWFIPNPTIIAETHPGTAPRYHDDPQGAERLTQARGTLRESVLETMSLLEARRDRLPPGDAKTKLCMALDALAAGHTDADRELHAAIQEGNPNAQ